jgi:hypothetical protein
MVFFRRLFSVAKSCSSLQALVAKPYFTEALAGDKSYTLFWRGANVIKLRDFILLRQFAF